MISWKKEIKNLTKIIPEKEGDLILIREIINKTDNDRGCALITASFAEDCIQGMIESALNLDLDREQLFGAMKPLSSFSAKILVAFGFNIIDKEIYDDLQTLKLIRNAFAHSRIPIDFKNSAIVEGCKTFKAPLTFDKEDFLSSQNKARIQYINVVSAIMMVYADRITNFLKKDYEKLSLPSSYECVSTLQ